jgi:hypothetical protein
VQIMRYLAAGLIAEALLELDQGAQEVGYFHPPEALMFLFNSNSKSPRRLQPFAAPDARG